MSLSRASASCSICRTCICKLQVCGLIVVCQSTDKILPRNRLSFMSGSEKFSLLMRQSTSSRFALNIQSFSCSLCNQSKSFLSSKNCWWTLTSGYVMRYCDSQRFPLVWDGMKTWNIPHEITLCLWERYQCRIIRCDVTRAGSGNGMSDIRQFALCVNSNIGTNLPATSNSQLGSHAVFVWKIVIPPGSAELTRKRMWANRSQDVQVVDVLSVALK